MARNFSSTVVRDMVVMRGNRSLEQAPSLVYADHTDEVASNRSSMVASAKQAASTLSGLHKATKTLCKRFSWGLAHKNPKRPLSRPQALVASINHRDDQAAQGSPVELRGWRGVHMGTHVGLGGSPGSAVLFTSGPSRTYDGSTLARALAVPYEASAVHQQCGRLLAVSAIGPILPRVVG
jgi:hypothetical protein